MNLLVFPGFKGSTADTNTQAAAKAFREKSVLLKRVVVVSDDLDDIVNEILTMQHEVGRLKFCIPSCDYRFRSPWMLL